MKGTWAKQADIYLNRNNNQLRELWARIEENMWPHATATAVGFFIIGIFLAEQGFQSSETQALLPF